MADFNKVKKGLGTPPALEDTKDNLDKPEVAPVEVKNRVGRPKSDRTAQITTSLRPDFKKKLQLLSLNTGLSMGEIIEEAVLYWDKNKQL